MGTPSVPHAAPLPIAAPPLPPASRVIGRLEDLDRRERREGDQALAEVLARWSLDGNREWLEEGVRRGEPFLQISPAAAGSVLAWEIRRLQSDGYIGVGPLWIPVRWLRDPAAYRRMVRLIAAHVLESPGPGAPVYVPKAHAELEPLLAMWPFVLAIPTSTALSLDDLIAARAWPVHPLGVVDRPTPADGQLLGPAEFLHHDLDHARFKVREDLLARGIPIPDAYQEGGTFDVHAGKHRSFLLQAQPYLDSALWESAGVRAARVASWLDAIAGERDRILGEAARWLLFELVHEKSLPIDAGVLSRALGTSTAVDRLQAKCRRDFYGGDGPPPGVVARLPAGREWLRALLDAAP